jgi:DNA polymerase I
MTGASSELAEIIQDMSAYGVQSGSFLAVAFVDRLGIGLAFHDRIWTLASNQASTLIAEIDSVLRPRWVWWSEETPNELVTHGVRVGTCWDIAAVHRLIHGGWKANPAIVWSLATGLSLDGMPEMGQLDLLSVQTSTDFDGGAVDVENPIQHDGYLQPEWVAGAWASTVTRLGRWAHTAANVAQMQRTNLAESPNVARRRETTAKSESAAQLLCSELAFDGLPIDTKRAEEIIEGFIGPRPLTEQHFRDMREARDEVVHAVAPRGYRKDLRNTSQVLEMLGAIGIDVTNTRAWRLEPFRGTHPFVDALLKWRKAERIRSTYGYAWLDEHVGADSRLRGAWTSCDGAAGRMTAQAGLHNMPADLRDAVAATVDHIFVHADLGQIEPRVLAAVAGDHSLAAATQSDDLYAPIATRLGVDRPVAKIAMLAAMYGQTSGVAGDVLRQMELAYPTAMEYLRNADRSGQAGEHVRTFGGRLVRMWVDPDLATSQAVRSAAAARGRYARNAVVQGAAAELFKAWAAIVRSRIGPLGGQLVMCLHDELLVHVKEEHGSAVARIVEDSLQVASRYWQPDGFVRFVAVAKSIRRWSEAK